MADNKSIWGVCGIRITPLVNCIPPVAGTPAALTYEQLGVASINLTADVREGVDDTQENACGGICAVVTTCDIVRKYSIDGEICSLCPDMLAGVIGIEAILNAAGDVIGHSAGNAGTACQDALIEIWSKAATANGQPCSATGDEYVKFILPRASLSAAQDFNLSSGFSNIGITGDAVANPLLTPAALNAAFPGAANGAVAWDLNSAVHVIVGVDAPPASASCEARSY